MERILFLYLDTGSGHVTTARILKSKVAEMAQQMGAQANKPVETLLLNAFSPKQKCAHVIWEEGYRFSTAFDRGIYSLFYDVNLIPAVLRLTTALVGWHTAPYLEKAIRRERITHIVCTHFAAVPAAWKASHVVGQKAGRDIPVTVVVTDPFSAHPAWFIVKEARYVVFSEEMRRYALTQGAKDVTVWPFVLGEQYKLGQGEPDINKSVNPAFNVLVTGGGEGLPGMVPLIREFLRRTDLAPVHVTIVCGHDRVAKKRIAALLARYPKAPVTLHGYVHNMPELLAGADCVVCKAGPLMVMEALALRKPLIVSTYIHGQERGNVRFIVDSGAGWFIQRPDAIWRKIAALAAAPDTLRSTVKRIEELNIRPDTEGLARYLLS